MRPHRLWSARFLALRTFAEREFVLLVSIVILTGSLWLFVAVTDEVREEEPHSTEKQIMRALRRADDPSQPIGPSWIKPASIELSALGSGSVLTLITAIAVGYLLMERNTAGAAFVLLATAGGAVLSQLLKAAFARDRPNVVPHLAAFTNTSYPSGHTMLSTIVYLTLAMVIAETLGARQRKLYVLAAALLIAFLVGVSRVVIGVHYPTDVLAGWTAGSVWALLCLLAVMWLKRRGLLRPPDSNRKP
ncbi:MAG TPA: phosphatase PAP2 family protein [Chthoniobacterales bacterium]